MSIVVNEKIGSRTLKRSALSSPTGKREFIVYESDTTIDKALTASFALRAVGVPQMGDVHPEDRTMTVISHDITADTKSTLVQNIVCNYAVTGLDGGGTYTAMSTGVRGIFMDTWRNSPNLVPVEGFGIYPVDIGGIKIDVGGKPMSIAIMQQTLDIRSPFANKPNFEIIRNLTNTRNATWFQGFPPTVLLYLGASASVTNGNIWTTTHKFAADELSHFRQVAKKEADGKTETKEEEPEEGSPPDAKPLLHAPNVFWAQKFPNLRNFGDLELGTTPF
jgi:hypothetical protein|tara:strand:+ start:93 stop:923 length:831 start_codon:yes stop_codon:yes gene_type:complete